MRSRVVSINSQIDDFFYKIKNKRKELNNSFSTAGNTIDIKNIIFLIEDNIIGLKFPFNPIIMSDIYKLFHPFCKSNYPYFDEKNQIYILELHFSNFSLLHKIVKKYRFEIEESCKLLLEYFEKNQKNETILQIKDNKIKIRTTDIFVNKYIDQLLKTLRG